MIALNGFVELGVEDAYAVFKFYNFHQSGKPSRGVPSSHTCLDEFLCSILSAAGSGTALRTLWSFHPGGHGITQLLDTIGTTG
jgi:hypothetical protein